MRLNLHQKERSWEVRGELCQVKSVSSDSSLLGSLCVKQYLPSFFKKLKPVLASFLSWAKNADQNTACGWVPWCRRNPVHSTQVFSTSLPLVQFIMTPRVFWCKVPPRKNQAMWSLRIPGCLGQTQKPAHLPVGWESRGKNRMVWYNLIPGQPLLSCGPTEDKRVWKAWCPAPLLHWRLIWKQASLRTSLAVQGLRLWLPVQKAWVQPLVKELDPTHFNQDPAQLNK